jgi:hypothetical protein
LEAQKASNLKRNLGLGFFSPSNVTGPASQVTGRKRAVQPYADLIPREVFKSSNPVPHIYSNQFSYVGDGDKRIVVQGQPQAKVRP